ncbi:sigma-70 family RNA polymerase sigma factor [uncultured Alistipes sp.]|uniref:RNA polymerase sigma factor n=1 Tax=uncultured Alistipes sp. TaxID=538949 RepID=UPI0025E75A29|nr:sigma-70 family RNA polymerase sigma factor [uncultured Alistipes sp.]
MTTIPAEAFERFVARHRRIIGKVCYLYATDSADFDDLRQEVLIALWRGFGSFEGRSAASTWVYRVSLNACISYCRRNRRHRTAQPLAEALAIADDDPALRERMSELAALLARLDPMEKALMALWLDELSYDEIAAVTGLQRNTVASRLHRIRLKLRREADR